MNLEELHTRLSKDANYRRAYEEEVDWPDYVLSVIRMRESQGLSQRKFADLVGVSAYRIGAFERFERIPGEVLDKIEVFMERAAQGLYLEGPSQIEEELTADPAVRGLTSRPPIFRGTKNRV